MPRSGTGSALSTSNALRPIGFAAYGRQNSDLIDDEEKHVHMKIRVAGVLAATASAVAMMGAPAFGSVAQGPINVGNIIGDGNTSNTSGNYVNAPALNPTNTCGIALAFLGFAEASCVGSAAAYYDSGNDYGSPVS